MYRLTLLFILLTTFLISCGGGNGTPDPEITGIQPDSGPEGTVVTISGNGFASQATGNEVQFNGTVAAVTDATESELVAAVPSGATSGAVSVTVGQNTAIGPNFTVEAAAPGISSVDPDSGVLGSEITIRGMNFSATASENSINFNGTPARVESATDTELITDVPQGATDGPIEVTVGQQSTTGPNFDVITDGTLQAVTETTGSDLDSNGYQLSLDGGSNASIGINDTLYFEDLESGSYDMELTDLAGNCTLSGSNLRTEDIAAGDTTTTSFSVDCQAVADGQVAFASDRDGDYEIYLMNTDGSSVIKLTDNSNFDYHPVISHDGTKIAFISDRGGSLTLYVMRSDGSDVQKIRPDVNNVYSTSWSPDDSKLAFADNPGNGTEIYTIEADGSGEMRLTNNSVNDYYTDWSPDDSRILYSGDTAAGTEEIYSMNPDGTDRRQLTQNADNDLSARWSPDGSKIIFVSNRSGNNEIFVMNADGTGVQQITNDPGSDFSPTWSPDGSEIIFSSDREGNREIYKINADGSGPVINLSTNSASEDLPHWSPVQ